MSLALVAGQSANAGGSSTTPAATLAASPTNGNLLVAFVAVNGGGTMTAANGYTKLDETVSTDSAAIFWKVASGDGTSQQPCTITSAAWNCHVMEFNGATTWALDAAHSGQASNGTNKTSPSQTPASGREMIVVGGFMSSAAADGAWSAQAFSGTNVGSVTSQTRATNQEDTDTSWANISSTSGAYQASATVAASVAGTGHIAFFYDSAVVVGGAKRLPLLGAGV